MKMHWNILFSLAFIVVGFKSGLTQVTIVNGLPGCLPVESQVGINCGGGTTFFGVNASNQFQVQNVDGVTCCTGPFGGGDGESYFEFATLDISNFTNVNISLGYSAANTGYEDDSPGAPVFGCTGNNPPDNSHDQIVFTYSIDGGPEVLSLYVHGNSAADFTGTWMAGPLNGSTLTIRIYASNKATAEIFYFQNLLITGTSTLSAGPDKTGCVNEPVDLDGVGSGNWSGGLGTFGDPSLAMTDYTPNPSELNSSVVLTFTGSPAYTGCPSPSDQMIINVNSGQNPAFSIADFCAPTSGSASGIASPGGTFSFDPPPGDGATINPATGVISNAVGSTTYSVKYVTPGPCPDEEIITVTATPGPSGTLSGNATLCPGECATFSFSFTSGNEPYTINLTASPPGFPLPPIPGVSAAQQFTVCYTGPGPFPTIDMSTFTINVPTIFSGTGTLNLTGISDGSGCPGTASGSFSLTLTPAPNALPAGPLTACADMNGDGTFNLTSLNNTVNGGNGSLTVSWYEDIDAMIPIVNPLAYISSGGTVYATVSNANCESSTVAVVLIVNTGNVPFLDMVCAESGLYNCNLCITGGMVDLGFSFADGATYLVTVRDNSVGSQYTGNASNTLNLTVPISGSTVFELISIQPLTGCPNFATYGNLVTINIINAPEIDPLTIQPDCQPITLPPITGNNLSGNQSYFTGPNGTGTMYNAGDLIFTSQTLYIFDTNAGCEDEEEVIITITPLITINEIPDIQSCVSAILPAITGNGLSSNTTYNTNPLGTGTNYAPGSMVIQSLTLYVFDPDADLNCVDNTVDVVVTIHPLPPFPMLSPINCTGSSGTVSLLTPTGSEYQYQLDGGAIQMSNVYANIPNGSHTIVVTNTTTTCQNTIQFSVSCDCPAPATLTLPQSSSAICAGDTLRINNVTFGGAATQVNLTSNGSGNFNATTFNMSPLTVVYIPSAADVGNTINITFTTNDPDGNGPCSPESTIYQLTIRSKPVGVITGSTRLCVGSDVSLTASGGLTYIWSEGGGNLDRATYTNIVSKDTFYVSVTDIYGCSDTVSHIVDVNEISAGRDTTAGFCNSVPSIVNLNDYITLGADRGGLWKNGVDTIFNASAYTITDLPLGLNVLRYIIVDSICGQDTSLLRVDIRSRNNAGTDNLFVICEGSNIPLNLVAAIGPFDIGGTWEIATSGLNINLSDPTAVDISSVNPGNYNVRYVISANGCAPDTALIGISVSEFTSAGANVISNSCIGTTINLLTLLNTSNLSGRILNLNNYTALSGSNWNTTGNMAGSYDFYYEINNVAPCSPDTARITILLEDVLNPGTDQIGSFCDGETLDLNDYLDVNAATGGRFYYQNQLIPNGLFLPLASEVNFVFIYEVGDDISCPKQTAIITLQKVPKPIFSMGLMQDICDTECVTLTNTHSAVVGSIFYYSISNSNGSYNEKENIPLMNQSTTMNFPFCSRSILPSSFYFIPAGETVTLSLDSIVTPDGCKYDYPDLITFSTLRLPEKSISPIICRDDIYLVGTEEFSFARPTGTAIKVATGLGCDTLINVNLQFYPEARGMYSETFCDEMATKIIGTQTFSILFPEGNVTLPGASVNGCDSIVQVSLKYEKTVSTGNLIINTCKDSYTYGGESFDKSRSSGPVLLPGGAIRGCDSLVNVLINFSEFTVSETLDYKCDGGDVQLILNLASHPGPYIIKIDGVEVGNIGSLPFSSAIVAGRHTVEISNAEGCTEILMVDVDDSRGPDVVLSQLPNQDGSVQITTTTPQNVIYDLNWTPSNTLSCDDCPNPIANPSFTTTYILSYLYGNQCANNREITVERLNTFITLPNIFSPDGDGKNDVFFVQFPDKVTGLVKSLSIYDRWGNQVFVAKDKPGNSPSDGWDGRLGSRDVVPGVYVYVIEVQIDGIAGIETYFGNLTLVK